MLGNHADHFMLAQFNEHVTAITPNAGGKSFDVPDRERAGTAHVTMPRGFQMPGPQRVVSSGFVPGASFVAPPRLSPDPSGALPGMGNDPSGALPGMGEGGQGVAVNLNTATLLGWGVIAAGLIFFLGRRNGEARSAPTEAVK